MRVVRVAKPASEARLPPRGRASAARLVLPVLLGLLACPTAASAPTQASVRLGAHPVERLQPLSEAEQAPIAIEGIAQDTGLAALVERIGAAQLPDGAGIAVGHVEALDGGTWALDARHPEFDGKRIVRIGPGAGEQPASSHATRAALHFFGSHSGVSPGVSSVTTYEAKNWLGPGFLWGAEPVQPQDVSPLRVFNNSWVGETGPFDPLYLRKLDWAVEQQDLVVVYGVANGAGPLQHALLYEAYNGIAVGRSDGRHAAGRTTLHSEGAGRQKPELVAPGAATSWATPLVSGAASLLLSVARSEPALRENPRAGSALLVKALLFCGAHKPLVWSNGAPSSGPLRGFTRTPLDPVLGAGELSVDRSHRILTSLEQAGAKSAAALSPVSSHGWNVIPIASGESRFWRFDFKSPRASFDAACVWNRQVSDDFQRWSLPDCNLRLWRVDPDSDALVSLLGESGRDVWQAGNVVSQSAHDNVELLSVRGLQPGQYALELWRGREQPELAGSRPAAVAWSAHAPEPEITCGRPRFERLRRAHPFGSRAARATSCAPRLETFGSASLTDPGRFDLMALELPAGAQAGWLVYGLSQTTLPFERGTLCVPNVRGALPVAGSPASSAAHSSEPGSGPCDGRLVVDARAWLQTSCDPCLAPGALVHAQFWFRAPEGAGTSPAVRFAIAR